MKVCTALLSALLLGAVARAQTLPEYVKTSTEDGGIRQLRSSNGPHTKKNRSKKGKSEKRRVFVKYDTAKGKKVALKLASKVYYDFKDEKSVVVELDETGIQALHSLKNDVVAVDDDTPMEMQGYLEGQLDPDMSSRRLQQTTPYGVTMVQAGQVSLPNYAYNRLKVCLVDTGVLYKHPDLPQKLMTGKNRDSAIDGTKLKWRKDVYGHGT